MNVVSAPRHLLPRGYSRVVEDRINADRCRCSLRAELGSINWENRCRG
jgi:hypothetical protein